MRRLGSPEVSYGVLAQQSWASRDLPLRGYAVRVEIYVFIGSQMVTPPLPVWGSNVLLCLSKPGASAGVLLLFGNQSFQMAL
jgi:hypothetical protein